MKKIYYVSMCALLILGCTGPSVEFEETRKIKLTLIELRRVPDLVAVQQKEIDLLWKRIEALEKKINEE